MGIETIQDIISQTVDELSTPLPLEAQMMPESDKPLPSVDVLSEIVSLIRRLIFPRFFDNVATPAPGALFSYRIGTYLEQLQGMLSEQIAFALAAESDESDVMTRASEYTMHLIEHLPEIKRLLYTDAQAMYDNDPAASNYGEVIMSYPTMLAMTHYRIAHEMHLLKVPILARIITERAHSLTGIDIHPGATIGEYFCIDHGTGVVIGETSIIGNHVTIYQGVTLGAKNFCFDHAGHPMNVPRHPIIEDHVTIYSNTSILGRITVGHDTIIGGNVWLTQSVPPGSKILQTKYSDQKI